MSRIIFRRVLGASCAVYPALFLSHFVFSFRSWLLHQSDCVDFCLFSNTPNFAIVIYFRPCLSLRVARQGFEGGGGAVGEEEEEEEEEEEGVEGEDFLPTLVEKRGLQKEWWWKT